ncbi:MAG: geranylgeranyl reductase family protein [Acidimicrobiales bacterium]|nr:geranylgeranyl reductase family protein [Acidimicrobiales bacterium]
MGTYDAVVVGGGPAGSVAATVLARGGARVALVDKAGFPRDKACGDVVGPRGVATLSRLGLVPPGLVELGDIEVVGPTGDRALLPALPGVDFPARGWAIPRRQLDHYLWNQAVAAGAEPVTARVAGVTTEANGEVGVTLEGAPRFVAGAVIGADGATSAVAASLGLVDPARVLWGFACRVYRRQEVERPLIALWDPERGRGFPGYGWLFPGPGGEANAGLGLGTGADRKAGSRAVRALDDFFAHLTALGLLDGTGRGGGDRDRAAPLGGWLKMGMVGTTPARGRVLLVGDAAGLVNPLQGEGIGPAVASAEAAALAVLAGPDRASRRYTAYLRLAHEGFMGPVAAVHTALIPHPRAISATGRLLTWGPLARAVGPAWSLYWNGLAQGARPGPGRRLALGAEAIAKVVTTRSTTRRWLESTLDGGGPARS